MGSKNEKSEKSTDLDYTKQDPKNCIIKFIKKIELPVHIWDLIILNDGRLGGYPDENCKFFIFNPKDFSIQMKIIFENQILKTFQMKNGLLAFFEEKSKYIYIIKLLSKTTYCILQKIEIYSLIHTFWINIIESSNENLIIGFSTFNKEILELYFYQYIKEKYELVKKQIINIIDSTRFRRILIFPLKTQILLYSYMHKKIIFIDSRKNKILYEMKTEEKEIKNIIKYDSNVIIINSYTFSILYNWKKHYVVKKYIHSNKIFYPYFSFSKYIIAQRGKMGWGFRQESLKLYKFIIYYDENDINIDEDNDNKNIVEEIKNLYLLMENPIVLKNKSSLIIYDNHYKGGKNIFIYDILNK